MRLAFLMLVLLVLIRIAMGNDSAPSYQSSVPKREEVTARQDDAPATPEFRVRAAQLFGDYHANEVAADARYKNRNFLISGEVDEIKKDFVDKPYVTLKTTNEFESIDAHLADTETSKAANLYKGQAITLQCTGKGMVVGSPMLENCVIK